MTAKSFYFLRHGETELNAKKFFTIISDVPLNENGRRQAETIRPILSSLPIQTICVSPYQRALETKAIATRDMKCQEVVIQELGECTGMLWHKLMEWEHNLDSPDVPLEVRVFLDRVTIGMQKVLSYPSPLIVAHGGVHFGMCHIIGIKNYVRRIDNCIPVHFYQEENAWKANVLFSEHSNVL